MDFIIDNIGLIIGSGIFGAIGTIAVVMRKKWKAFLLSEHTQKTQDLNIDDKELNLDKKKLDVLKEHQEYIDSRLLALIEENKAFLDTISRQRDEIAVMESKYLESQTKIEECQAEFKKAYRMVKYYKKLLETHKIEFEPYE